MLPSKPQPADPFAAELIALLAQTEAGDLLRAEENLFSRLMVLEKRAEAARASEVTRRAIARSRLNAGLACLRESPPMHRHC